MAHGGLGTLVAERVEELIRTSAPDTLIGLCFLALDSSRSVHDHCEHPVDDRLLTAVTQRLDRGLAGPGHLLARAGDEELVILVTGPELAPGAAVQVAGQMVHLLADPFQVGGQELIVSASVGVVERTAAETTCADLLAGAADLRTRMSKAGDRGRWMAVDLDRARAVVRMR
jgi:diguanylate cyclase (GGDEF)-like protein